MKKGPNHKFYDQIQDLMNLYELDRIESKLPSIEEEYRKAFLIIIFAGYSIETALKNYRNFYRFVNSNFINYSHGIKMIKKIANNRENGMVINDLTVYELN
jgi:hypothetical protein